MLLRLLLILLILVTPSWGQYDFYETFEGGVCVETWAGSCPSTISADTGLSGSSNLLNPGITIGPTSLAASSLCMSFEYRKPGNPGTSQQVFEARNAAALDLWQAFHVTTGVLRVTNRGGTDIDLATMSNDTKYTVEICYQEGTANDSKVKARLNGGSFTETTNGTTETPIHDLRIRENSLDGERFDDIKVCAGTYVGVSECDVPPDVNVLTHASSNSTYGFWPGPFEVQAQALPDGEEEAAYDGAQFTAINNPLSHTWAIDSGALPSGLSLSASGGLTGTPGVGSAGTYNFVVMATDSGGGKARRDFSLSVQNSGADTLSFYEDAEDGNLTAAPVWTAPGGCASTANGFMEGSREVSKTTATDCVWIDNVDLPAVYFGFDHYRNGSGGPATDRDQMLVGLDSAGAVLFSCRVETDFDLWCKTAGQTDNNNRGIFLVSGPNNFPAGTSKYAECHWAKGTGAPHRRRNTARVLCRHRNDQSGPHYLP